MSPPNANTPDETSDATPPKASRRGFPRGGPNAEELRSLRAQLLDMRAKILRSSADLAEEALKSSGQDYSIDHMADHGSDNAEQAVSLSLLEGESEIVTAIEVAIRKIDGNEQPPFGICGACAEDEAWDEETTAPWIPTARLRVVPYATLCVAHQEEQEGELS